MPKANSWGDIYDRNLRRGYDHGYAAWVADQWEKKQRKGVKPSRQKAKQEKPPALWFWQI